MTVITKPIVENKPADKSVAGGSQTDPNGDQKVLIEEGPVETPVMMTVRSPGPAPRNVKLIVTSVLYILLLLIMILLSTFVYSYYVNSQQSHVSRLAIKCRVGYHMPNHVDVLSAERAHLPALPYMLHFHKGMFIKKLDLDVGANTYAEIVLPGFENMGGWFIHDYEHNTSAIVHMNMKRCLVFPLDSNHIAAPVTIHRIVIRAMTDDGIIPRKPSEIFRETQEVIRPPINVDPQIHGRHVHKRCKDFETFRTARVTSSHFPVTDLRIKRSVDEAPIPAVAPSGKNLTMVEFAGKYIIEYTILDE